MRVYLDTQDYSKLADAAFGIGHQELCPLLADLVAMADSGQVHFCFSQVLIGELLQVAPTSFEIAQRKATIVERLCGNRGFPNPFWLFRAELADLVPSLDRQTDSARARINRTLQQGLWLREELASSTDLSQFDPLAGLPWPVRAVVKLASRFVSEKTARAALRSSPLFHAAANTPLEENVVAYLMRRIDGAQLMTHLCEAFSRPTNLVSHREIAAPLLGLNKSVHQFGLHLMQLQQGLRDNLDRAAQEIGVPLDPAQLRREAAKSSPQILLNVARRPAVIFDPPALVEYVNDEGNSERIKELPFARFFGAVFAALATQATPAKHRRKPRASDGGDLLHVLYAPYCDVLRTDAAFSETVGPIALGAGCQIVGRLTDLPDMLRHMLNQRRRS